MWCFEYYFKYVYIFYLFYEACGACEIKIFTFALLITMGLILKINNLATYAK